MQNSTLNKTGLGTSLELIETLIAVFFITALIPFFILNALLSLTQLKSPLTTSTVFDACGGKHFYSQWNHGPLKSSLLLLKILSGEFSFCGISLCNKRPAITLRSNTLKPGIFSVHQLHQTMGYIEMSHSESLKFHENKRSLIFDISLAAKSIVAQMLFDASEKIAPKRFDLLGVSIDNVSKKEALSFIFDEPVESCRSLCFINAHSINLSCSKPDFRSSLNQADCLLADGSGVRLGASIKGVKLRDNINGTDLLPHICRRLQQNGESVFLFGSEPGVAKRAADKLQKKYPGLKIAGTHHGYINQQESDDIVEKINGSGAALCLVALGSPVQERWIEENKHKLECHTVMAVGGLFDFYSGKIARAPRWMREIGMEWLFRLAMEPKVKFKRYVIGNPLYIARILSAYS